MKLHVVISDASVAVHIGGNMEVRARSFDLPEEVASYIRRNRAPHTSIALAIEDTEAETTASEVGA